MRNRRLDPETTRPRPGARRTWPSTTRLHRRRLATNVRRTTPIADAALRSRRSRAVGGRPAPAAARRHPPASTRQRPLGVGAGADGIASSPRSFVPGPRRAAGRLRRLVDEALARPPAGLMNETDRMTANRAHHRRLDSGGGARHPGRPEDLLGPRRSYGASGIPRSPPNTRGVQGIHDIRRR